MPRLTPMDPPFGSAKQASLFAIALAGFLVLPSVLTASRLISRKNLYSTASSDWGVFSFIHRQIFEEKSDVDILVLGTSITYQAIDSAYLEQSLSKTLNRPARVITFGTNWRCEMQNYLLLRDMLERRKVRMLLFSMPIYTQHEWLPHLQSYRWVLPGEDDLRLNELGLKYQLTVYAGTVLGGPRRLVSALRPDIIDPSPLAPIRNGDIASVADEHGAVKIDLGMRPDKFVRWTPAVPKIAPQEMIYSANTRQQFRFSGEKLNEFQRHFLNLSFDLLARKHVAVGVVHIPLWEFRTENYVEERMDWAEMFARDMTLIGVPPSRLFAGFTEAETGRMFYSSRLVVYPHLNRNGNEYFTRAVAPGIVDTYVRKASNQL